MPLTLTPTPPTQSDALACSEGLPCSAALPCGDTGLGLALPDPVGSLGATPVSAGTLTLTPVSPV